MISFDNWCEKHKINENEEFDHLDDKKAKLVQLLKDLSYSETKHLLNYMTDITDRKRQDEFEAEREANRRPIDRTLAQVWQSMNRKQKQNSTLAQTGRNFKADPLTMKHVSLVSKSREDDE